MVSRGLRSTPGTTHRGISLLLLLAAYLTLAITFRQGTSTDTLHTHLAYVPIVLAGIWCGWWALWIAAGLGGLTAIIGTHASGIEALWTETPRALLFVLVAAIVVVLRPRGMAGARAGQGPVEKYRLLVEKSIAGMLVCEGDKILFASERFAAMLGRSRGELLGASIGALIHEEDRGRVRDLITTAGQGQHRDLRFECRLLRRDQGAIWVAAVLSGAEYEGKAAALVSTYDITEKRKAESQRLELKDRSARQELQIAHATGLAELGEMAAMIAHELNQPLTGIRTFAGNARYMIDHDVGSPAEVKENLKCITEQVDKAASVISHVRELTRKTQPQFELLDVNTVVRKAVDFLDAQLRLSSVEVAVDLCADLPRVLGHSVRLEQVLLNLLANARHAMRDAPVRRLRLRTFLRPRSPHPVGIEISDTGEGFDPGDKERLFKPFFTTKDAGHGTGLGLSISSTTIKEHKGKIEATGSPGKGATFTILLPVPQKRELREEGSPG